MLNSEICELEGQKFKVNTRIALLNRHQVLKKKENKSSTLAQRTKCKYPLDIAMN